MYKEFKRHTAHKHNTMSATVLEAPVVKTSDPILVVRSHQSLKNHTLHIIKVWVRRFVENGDQVQIRQDGTDIVFECPDYLSELHVMMLCDTISQLGFAKAIFCEREY
jgi:hypothetical protein